MISLDTITTHASSTPDSVAISDGLDRLTWHEFETNVRSASAWLTTVLEPHVAHRAVGFAENTPEFIVATAALTSIGVPWVGIDPARTTDTVLAQLGAVNPTIVVVDSSLSDGPAVVEWAHHSGAAVLDLSRAGHADRTYSYQHAVAFAGHGRPWTPQPFSALGFTSGTTGIPKLFVRRSKSENQRLTYLRDHFGFNRDDVYLVTSPLAHASGHVWANAALTLGAHVVLGDADPARIIDAIEAERVTTAFMVPPTADAFLAAASRRPDADLSSLRALLTGGRHISHRTIRQARERLGQILHLYYATTETGINTFACPDQLERDPLTAGSPMPGVTLRIVDPVSHAGLDTGQVGQIAISSPLNMDGYTSAQADLLTVDDRSYVLTSDYGYLATDGQLFIQGRSDALPGDGSLDIVSLEAELKELSSVADVCVVRRPDGDGVRVVAAVCAESDDVLDAVIERLDVLLADGPDDHCAVAVAAIPYNTAGKVDLRLLDRMLEEAATPVG